MRLILYLVDRLIYIFVFPANETLYKVILFLFYNLCKNTSFIVKMYNKNFTHVHTQICICMTQEIGV